MHRAMKVVTCMLVVVGLLFGASSPSTASTGGHTAEKAAGGSPATLHEGVEIYLHAGNGLAIDLTPELEADHWPCLSSADSDDTYVVTEPEFKDLILWKAGVGSATVTWQDCSHDAAPTPRTFEVKSFDVVSGKFRHVKRLNNGRHSWTVGNPNVVVRYPNDDVALNNTLVCKWGSFSNPSPDGSRRLLVDQTKGFSSPYSARQLDWMCWTAQDGILAGYRDGTSKMVPTSGFTRWGVTFARDKRGALVRVG